MNNITTDIITTTGINISKYDILPSKIFINGIEIIDTETWNKVISSIDVKDKEIDRLNNVINELEKELNKDYETYICKNKSYGKTFKAGANIYREHILHKLKELKENRDER